MTDKKKEVVRGIIFDSLGRILILKRPDGTHCLPGGKVEESDLDYEFALIRELEQELQAEVEAVKFFDHFSINVENKDWENYFYLVVVSNRENLQINEESLELIWVDREHMGNYVFAFSNEVYIEKAFELRNR